MNEFETALITGASSGIGYSFAKELAKGEKHNILITARREDRLIKLKQEIEESWSGLSQPPTVGYIVADLVDKNDRSELINQIKDQNLEIDLLINNAGFGSVQDFCSSDLERQLEMIELNVKAAVHLCHAFLPAMRKRKSGYIINVCSTASYQPMPYMATYGASKSFLRNFSLALNAEVRKDNVVVMAHCPGPTESEFHIAAGLKDKIANLPGMTSEQVAKEALSGIKSRSSLLINGLSNKLGAAVSHFLPLNLSAALVERILRKHA